MRLLLIVVELGWWFCREPLMKQQLAAGGCTAARNALHVWMGQGPTWALWDTGSDQKGKGLSVVLSVVVGCVLS